MGAIAKAEGISKQTAFRIKQDPAAADVATATMGLVMIRASKPGMSLAIHADNSAVTERQFLVKVLAVRRSPGSSPRRLPLY